MKNIKKYFLILIIIKTSLSLLPVWNLTSSSINLLENTNNFYNLVEKDFYYAYYKIQQNFIIDQNGNIIQKYYLQLGKSIEDIKWMGEIDFDEIESAYADNSNNFIVCPKGRFHPYIYFYNNYQYHEIREPPNFKEQANWDLKCYYQPNENKLFVSYLNSEEYFYEFSLYEQKFLTSVDNLKQIYGFKWRISNPKYMYAIEKENNKFYLKRYEITISDKISKNQIGSREFTSLKNKYLGFFRKDNLSFCFINYNDKNVSDFESGYLNENLEPINDDDSTFNSITISINQASPFEFLENVTINSISFIYDTQYVYYNISINNEINKFYYGIIDITLNKVVFNTNEDILVFKPYSDNAMLAITNKTVYKICIIRKGDECLYKCDNDILPTFDSTGYNNCENKCESKIFLMPDNICIKECDENLFTLNNNQCWLCKDLSKEYKYKFINHTGCRKDMPINSKFVNEHLFLIDCIEGSHYSPEQDQCILDKCHPNCIQCTSFSENYTEQNCLSCKNEKHVLENGNCVDNCSIGFFLEGKNCKKCDISCKTCNKNKNMCTECEDGKYLDKSSEIHTCKKCSENCLTCSDGEDGEIKNCILCNQSSDFIYFFNKSCWKECPDKNMSKSDKNECYYQNEENHDENYLAKKDTVMLCIFIVITSILFLIIIICFYKSLCCKGKKEGQHLIDEINKELIEKELTE